MSDTWQPTDAELLAWIDEDLDPVASARVETFLRDRPPLLSRLEELLADREKASLSLGEIWRRQRISCPPRTLWQAYLDGSVGDGVAQYLLVHLNLVGCRVCQANVDDLGRGGAASEDLQRKIFSTSIGRLPRRNG